MVTVVKTRVPTVEEIRARMAGCAPASQVGASAVEVLDARKAVGATDPKTLRQSMDDILRIYGLEPAEELVKLVMERNQEGAFIMSRADRVDVLLRLLEYRMPKLKSVEVQGKVDHTLTVVVRKFGDFGEGPRVIPVNERFGGG